MRPTYTCWIPASPSCSSSLQRSWYGARRMAKAQGAHPSRAHGLGKGGPYSASVGLWPGIVWASRSPPYFELEGSTRHLVGYTMLGDTFSEVSIDATTGKGATVKTMEG